MQSLIVQIPEQKTFHLPEGSFSAVCIDVTAKEKVVDQRTIQQVKFLFEVNIPSVRLGNGLAGRTFEKNMNKGSHLRRFLEGWIGPDCLKENQKFNLGELIGRSAELILTHFHSPDYEKPHVTINSAYPSGTLNLSWMPIVPVKSVEGLIETPKANEQVVTE